MEYKVKYKVKLLCRYECEEIGTWEDVLKVQWVRSVTGECCQSCNGTVVPANTVISTTQLEDDCLSLQTEVCRLRPGLDKAVIDQEFSYRSCRSKYLYWMFQSGPYLEIIFRLHRLGIVSAPQCPILLLHSLNLSNYNEHLQYRSNNLRSDYNY